MTFETPVFDTVCPLLTSSICLLQFRAGFILNLIGLCTAIQGARD